MTRRLRPKRGQPDPERPKEIRCAIYTRKSTEEGLQQEFNSLDAQREAAEAFIASQRHEGWTCLPDRYDDGGYTGGNMDRPALKRLLAEVEAGRVDCIVCYKVDRLSRSLLDFARIMGTLDEHEVSFVSVTQAFNTTTSMGRLTLNVLLSFAQFEREIIAERTRDKMSAARKKGKWVGGMPVLGYNVDPQGGRLIVNQAEAERVRGIFDLYLQKESLVATVRELNRQRWTTKAWVTKKGRARGGLPFDKTILSRLLANQTYSGQVNYHDTVYPGEHEAIVEEAVWQRARQLLLRNGRTSGSATRNVCGALLRGLLHCTPCDSAMIHSWTQKRNGARYKYYVCSRAQKRGWDSCPTKSIPAGEIERFVLDRIRCIGTDPDLLAEVMGKLRDEAEARSGQLAGERQEVEKDLARCAAEVRKIVGSTGRTRASEATARLAELQDRISAAEQRLSEIRAQEAALERDHVDEADLATAMKSFDPVWETLTPRERARILHLLIERVTYDGGTETVAITFRPSGIRTLAQEVA